MPLLKESVIDSIKDQATIVEVAEQLGLDLKKSGSNFKCNSPWTDEKSASCMFSPQKNIFKDFSSGKGGGPIQLIKEVKGIEWLESIKFLADMYHVQLDFQDETPEEEERRSTREQVLKMLEASQKKYMKCLQELPEDHPAKVYVNQRFTPDEQLEWSIGYSPNSWDFIRNLSKEAGQLEVAITAGLVLKKSASKCFDFYRDRIMFPICDRNGRVISFNARVYPGSSDENPKYINGSDTDVFKKSKILYGLHRALPTVYKTGSITLVEGGTDVIAMHSVEIDDAVATCGTAFNSNHIELLKKLKVHTVTLLQDGDAAGVRAMEKNILLILAAGMRVDVIALPDNQDPYSYLKSQTSTAQ